MRKAIVMLLVLALVSAISMAMVVPARAALTVGQWQPPYVDINGTVIYKDGATASALVTFKNDVGPTFVMNVSKITLEFFNLGINKSLDMSTNPHMLQHDEFATFIVSFIADDAEFYPGRRYDFNLIIEWVNATTGPTRVVGNWEYPTWWTGMPWFEVYPAAQVDAMDSLTRYNSYYSFYSGYFWQSMLAREKATLAVIEKGAGDTYYERGDYASALGKYNSANTLWGEAVAAEKDLRTTMEDAELNVTLTEAWADMKQADAALIEANAAKVEADAAITNAYGWYFIGIGFAIGFSLLGVGAIIYALRKPKPPA